MTKQTIYTLVKGKSYYNGISALTIQGLKIEAIYDEVSIVVGNNKFIWNIFYAKGLHNKHAWFVSEPLER